MRKFNSKLAKSPFGNNVPKEVVNFLKYFPEVNVDFLKRHVEWRKNKVLKEIGKFKKLKRKRRKRWVKKTKKCPECKSPMDLGDLNTNKRDQTGDDSKSVWVCENFDCMECIYNKESVKKILKTIGWEG